MNVFVIGLIVLIIGATVGGLIEYLLGLVLPNKPQKKHIITITATIFILAWFVVWVSSLNGKSTEIPTVTTSVGVTPAQTEVPESTDTPIPQSSSTATTPPTPTFTPHSEPTNTATPKPTSTIQVGYPTNNPGKWLLDIRYDESGYILDDKGTRNNLEAARKFQPVDREIIFNLFEESGRVMSAYENYLVDCDQIHALVAFNQEVMTFSTEEGAQHAFEYFLNDPEKISFTSAYLNPDIFYIDEGPPGTQRLEMNNPRSFYYCGESLELFEAIEIFQRENLIGITTSVGRDYPNTSIFNHFFAIDLDLNVIADP